jgi:hypothetical protein
VLTRREIEPIIHLLDIDERVDVVERNESRLGHGISDQDRGEVEWTYREYVVEKEGRGNDSLLILLDIHDDASLPSICCHVRAHRFPVLCCLAGT